jgi:hypothetical protein
VGSRARTSFIRHEIGYGTVNAVEVHEARLHDAGVRCRRLCRPPTSGAGVCSRKALRASHRGPSRSEAASVRRAHCPDGVAVRSRAMTGEPDARGRDVHEDARRTHHRASDLHRRAAELHEESARHPREEGTRKLRTGRSPSRTRSVSWRRARPCARTTSRGAARRLTPTMRENASELPSSAA